MNRIFTFIMTASLALGQGASAKPKDEKEKEMPPGQARKAAATAHAAGVSRPAISTSTRVRSSELSNDARRTATASPTYSRQRTSTPAGTYREQSSQPSTTYSRQYSTGGSSYDRQRSHDGDRDGRDYRSDRYGSRYGYSRPSVEIYRDWDRGRVHTWNNHRYHWYGGSWVIYDATPAVIYSERSVSGSVVAEVQAELRRRGYNAGPADGVMGGRTRSAIAEFQEDRGMEPTGRITESLLRELGLA
jgi:hypothetical protein